MRIPELQCKECRSSLYPFKKEVFNMFTSIHYKCSQCQREIDYWSWPSLISMLIMSGGFSIGTFSVCWSPDDTATLGVVLGVLAFAFGSLAFFGYCVYELIRRIRGITSR